MDEEGKVKIIQADSGLMQRIKLKIKNKENLILPIFLFIHAITLYLPYWLNGYKMPVGWDTPSYINYINFISKKGFYDFFYYKNGIAFYSILEYFISVILHISPIILEKYIPIIMGVLLTLINYLVIKQLYNSRKLEVIVLIFSIINVNTMRLVTDLHRNLFSLILVEFSLFILLPKYLKEPTKRGGVLLILLLVLAGLSQIETFFIAIVTLSCLFIQSLSIKSFNKIKHIFLITFSSTLIYIFINLPFLAYFLSKYMLFNPIFTILPVTKLEDYIIYLGGSLIPLYIIGLYLSIEEYMKKRTDLYLLLFIWNIILILGSFLPMFGVMIYGWRFILITTIPIISTIGITILYRWKLFIKIEENKPIQIKKILIVLTLIILISFTSIHYINNTQIFFKPWISNDTYEKLIWISTKNRTDPSIFVLYFNHGEWTNGYILFYESWIKAILGPDTGVYFGMVNSLLLGLPTSINDEMANLTSYVLWEDIRKMNITEVDIFLIDDWYSVANQTILVEIYPGIYKVSNNSGE